MAGKWTAGKVDRPARLPCLATMAGLREGFGVVLAGISDKLKKLWRTYITRLTRKLLISR